MKKHPESSMDNNIHNLNILSERILELGACVTLLIITFMGSLIGSSNSTICAIFIVANTLYILFNMTLDHYWYIMKPLFTMWNFWLVYSVFWLQSDFPIENESPPWTHIFFSVIVYGTILYTSTNYYSEILLDQTGFGTHKIYSLLAITLVFNTIPFMDNFIFNNPIISTVKFTILCTIFLILRHIFPGQPITQTQENVIENACKYMQINYVIFAHIYVVIPMVLIHIISIFWRQDYNVIKTPQRRINY